MTNTFIGSGSQFDHTYDLELPGQFEGLPADPKKRELIKGYVTEALQYRQEKELADKREKGVYASVKESTDYLEITPAYFKSIVDFKHGPDKKREIRDKVNAAEEGTQLLGLGD